MLVAPRYALPVAGLRSTQYASWSEYPHGCITGAQMAIDLGCCAGVSATARAVLEPSNNATAAAVAATTCRNRPLRLPWDRTIAPDYSRARGRQVIDRQRGPKPAPRNRPTSFVNPMANSASTR